MIYVTLLPLTSCGIVLFKIDVYAILLYVTKQICSHKLVNYQGPISLDSIIPLKNRNMTYNIIIDICIFDMGLCASKPDALLHANNIYNDQRHCFTLSIKYNRQPWGMQN